MVISTFKHRNVISDVFSYLSKGSDRAETRRLTFDPKSKLFSPWFMLMFKFAIGILLFLPWDLAFIKGNVCICKFLALIDEAIIYSLLTFAEFSAHIYISLTPPERRLGNVLMACQGFLMYTHWFYKHSLNVYYVQGITLRDKTHKIFKVQLYRHPLLGQSLLKDYSEQEFRNACSCIVGRLILKNKFGFWKPTYRQLQLGKGGRVEKQEKKDTKGLSAGVPETWKDSESKIL